MCKIRIACDFIAKMTSLKKKCGCDVQARSQNKVFLGKRKIWKSNFFTLEVISKKKKQKKGLLC